MKHHSLFICTYMHLYSYKCIASSAFVSWNAEMLNGYRLSPHKDNVIISVLFIVFAYYRASHQTSNDDYQ